MQGPPLSRGGLLSFPSDGKGPDVIYRCIAEHNHDPQPLIGTRTPAKSVLRPPRPRPTSSRSPASCCSACSSPKPRHGERGQAVRTRDAGLVRDPRAARPRPDRAEPRRARRPRPALRTGPVRVAGWQAFVALGAIVLAVTGAEALYADMGHLAAPRSASPGSAWSCPGSCSTISARVPWFCAIPPRSSTRRASGCLIGLATCATIIASQAVISGVFSLTRQAVQLGYLPRMPVSTPRPPRSAKSTSRASTGY